MSDTYTASLIGSESTETVELEFIGGLPQKSIVRPAAEGAIEGADDQVWELVLDGEGYEYRPAGAPGADYS